MRLISSQRLAMAILALSGAVCLVNAQATDSTRSDSSRISRRRHALPPVVVTGKLSAFDAKDGVARSAIDRGALRAEPARNFLDPLRHATGVFIDEANGPNGPTIIRLRGGEETFTRVLIDGVEINENGGFFDAQGLTTVGIDRIEVARGPQSALYGSSAVSGVVQMFTRSGEPGPLRMDGLVETGRASQRGVSARSAIEGTGGTERARYAFGAGTVYDRGIYRIANDLRAHDASARGDFLIGDAFSLTALARFMGVDSKLPVRDPGATRAPLDPNQRQARDRWISSLQGTWQPSDGWIHRLSLAQYVRDFTYEDRSDMLDQSQFSTYVFDANFRYDATVRRSTARYVTTMRAGDAKSRGMAVSAGAEWETESLSDYQSGDFGPGHQSLSRPSISGFGEAQIRATKWLTLGLGSRTEKVRGLAAATVPRATAVIDVMPDVVALRGSLSRAYRAPNIQDQFPSTAFFVTNPDLKPETSLNQEVGIDLHAIRATTLSLTYFVQTYDNLVRSVQYDATRQIHRNLGKIRAAGIEAELEARPSPIWRAGAQSSWLSTRIIDNGGLPPTDFPNDSILPFRPAYTASGFIANTALRHVEFLVRSTIVGRQTVLANRFNGPRVSVEPYGLLSATATIRSARLFDCYLRVDNILNRNYATAFDREGLSRSAVIGLRTK